MIVDASLTEDEIKAFKARKERELGAGWCVDLYRWQGRWLARAYQNGRRPKKVTKYRVRSEQRLGGTAASASGLASP